MQDANKNHRNSVVHIEDIADVFSCFVGLGFVAKNVSFLAKEV